MIRLTLAPAGWLSSSSRIWAALLIMWFGLASTPHHRSSVDAPPA
jgi:hypothetical protein